MKKRWIHNTFWNSSAADSVYAHSWSFTTVIYYQEEEKKVTGEKQNEKLP